MSPSLELSIIIPTYNERENIKRLIPEIENLLKERKFEIIVVDDSSPDGTAQEAEQLNKKYKNIRVITRPNKEGIGAALRQGYNEARGEILFSTDSDLSYETSDITRLLEQIDQGYDLVLGSRHLRATDYTAVQSSTKVKNFVSSTGNVITRVLSGVPVHDFSANFRAIRREVWKSIQTKENTNTLLLEMIMKTFYKGYKVTELPITFKERVYGESKLNLGREAPKFMLKLLYFVTLHKLRLWD